MSDDFDYEEDSFDDTDYDEASYDEVEDEASYEETDHDEPSYDEDVAAESDSEFPDVGHEGSDTGIELSADQ